MNINSLTSTTTAYGSSGISGLASGIDTESMVQKMLSGTQAKIDKQKQNKQVLQWKQSIYQGLISKITSFQSKYFDALKKTSLTSAAFFNQRKASATGNALSVLANANAAVGTTRVQVAQLAKAAEASSSGAVSGDLAGAVGTLGDSTTADGAFKRQVVFEVYGSDWSSPEPNKITVDFDYGDSASDIVDKVNTALTNAGAGTATLDADGKMQIEGAAGKQLKVDASSTNMGLKALGLTANGRTVKADANATAKMTSVVNANAQASLEVTLNGTTRTVTLDEKKLRQAGNMSAELARQLEEGIHANNAFGQNAGVHVKLNASGEIEFDPIDKGQRISLGGDKAALELIGQKDGASNMINLNQRIGDVKFSNGTLTANTKIKNAKGDLVDAVGFTINGQEFKFSMDTSINTMISKINNSEAGVKIEYDTFGDQFKFSSTQTGKGYTIEMSDTVVKRDADGNPIDNNGNILADGDPLVYENTGSTLAFMFGQTAADGVGKVEITEGQNAVVNINGIWTERDSNTFTVNGLTLTLNDTTSAYKTVSGNLTPPAGGYEGGHSFAWNAQTGSYNHTYTDQNGNSVTDRNVTLYDDGNNGFYTYDNVSKTYMHFDANGALEKETDGSVKQFSLSEIADGTIDLTDPAIKSEEIKITTERDDEKLLETVKTFIEDYNAIIKEIQDLTGAKATYKDYPPLTDEQKKDMSDREVELWEEKAKTGLLRQDQTLISFTSSMRSAMYEKPSGNSLALYDLGIETSASWKDGGILSFDENKLKEMIAKDPDAITRLFTDPEEGLASKLSNVLTEVVGHVGTSGTGTLIELAGREGTSSEKTNSIYKQLNSIDAKLDNLKRQYNSEKARYWKQFNQMEQAIQQMNSQSSWLTQQLG